MGIFPYILLILSVVLVLVLDNEYDKKILKILPYVFLAIFSGFRYDVGKDYPAYERIFYYVNNNVGNEENFLETGYLFIIKFINSINGTQQLVFLIFAVITQVLMYKYIKKHSINFFISTLLFVTIGAFYLSSFNGVRQAFCIALFAFSIRYIVDKKIFKFTIIILLGATIHKSILFMLPLYFLLRIKITFTKILVSSIAIIIIMKTGFLTTLINSTFYGNHLEENVNSALNLTTILFFIISIVIVILGKRFNFVGKEKVFYNLNFFSMILIFGSFFSSNLPDMFFLRINNYFMVGYLILVPYIINRIQGNLIIKYIMFIFVIVYYLNTIITGSNMLPYNMNSNLFKFD